LSRTLAEKSVKLGIEIILIKKCSLLPWEVSATQWEWKNAWDL